MSQFLTVALLIINSLHYKKIIKRIMKNNQNRRSYCIRNILILMKKESVHQNY